MTTIEAQVFEFKETTASKAPPEIGGVFAGEQQQLAHETDRAEFGKVGDRLAPFELPDATGQPVSLKELLADGPAVMVFYRGAWCPYCNIALHTYGSELAPALAERGVRLVAISPQLPDGSMTMQEKHELAFPVLSDPSNAVAGPLGIVFATTDFVREVQLQIGIDVAGANGQPSPSLPMPTVLVLDEDAVIRYIDVHPDYTARTEVPEILAAVDALQNR